MDVIVAGATGFIGRALVSELVDRGDTVVALTRDPSKTEGLFPASVETLPWSPPAAVGEWAERAKRVDAIVNLAGEPVADKRWTDSQKQRILSSRLDATNAVVEAQKLNTNPGRTLVNASAIGYYGSRGDEVLTEASSAGNDFLAGVVVQWEGAAMRASASGARVALIRNGIVLGLSGGALPRMVLPFKLFAGGVMGPGDQWMSWIHLEDEIGIILQALDNDRLSGAVNATSPNPVQMKDFSRAIGRATHRPVWAPGIAVAMKLILGERTQVVFSSQRVEPAAAVHAGYGFKYRDVDAALVALRL